VAYAYRVDHNGQIIVRFNDNIEPGRYIDEANIHQKLFVEYHNTWNKTVSISNCEIQSQEDGAVFIKSEQELNEEDYCIDQNRQKLLFITKIVSMESTTSTVSEGYSIRDRVYEGVIIPDENRIKHVYIEKYHHIIKLYSNKWNYYHIFQGYAIFDKMNEKPFDSLTSTSANAYRCQSGWCEMVSEDNLPVDTHFVNSIGNIYPVLLYKGEGQWIVEKDEGYYFFNAQGEPIKSKEYVWKAYRIYIYHDKVVHKDIYQSNEIGYYLNKAYDRVNEKDNLILFFDEYKFWTKSEIAHSCKVKISEEKNHYAVCQTFTMEEVYEAGEYCFEEQQKQIFLLVHKATYDVQEVNCLYGVRQDPLYIHEDSYFYSDIGSLSLLNVQKILLNGVEVDKQLIELTQKGIRKIDQGYYLLNMNGTLANDMSPYNDTLVYYCNDNVCKTELILDKNVILNHDGEILQLNGVQKTIVKINKPGYYLFSKNKLWTMENDHDEGPLDRVIRVIRRNNTVIKDELSINELDIGTYINEVENNSIYIYNGKRWSIVNRLCYNDINDKNCDYYYQTKVGDYVNRNGTLNLVIEVDEESKKMTYLAGDDERPMYITTSDLKLARMTQSSYTFMKENGFYIIDAQTRQSVTLGVTTESVIIQCTSNGNHCVPIQPKAGSSYLNKASIDSNDYNIVYYPTENVNEFSIMNDYCNVVNIGENEIGESIYKCYLNEGEVNPGKVCIDQESLDLFLLLMDDQGQGNCVKVISNDERYFPIENKLYMINSSIGNVEPQINGYYFINKFNHEVTDREGYNNEDVIGYMCNYFGKCEIMEPDGLDYFIDYNTLKYPYFNVIQFKSSNLQSRDEGTGYNGYEMVKEEGLYHLNDGYYAVCFYNDHEEIACGYPDVSLIGSTMDHEEKLTLCKENEDQEVQCTEASEGGYYLLDDQIIECEADEDKRHLNCHENEKEGYFILSNDDNPLYSCSYSHENTDNDDTLNTDYLSSDTEETSTTTEYSDEYDSYMETLSTSTDTTMSMPTTLGELKCSEIGKKKGKSVTIKSANETIELYHYDDGEWVSTCQSGNYIKEDSHYLCEDNLDSVDPDKIKSLNIYHTLNSDDEIPTTTLTKSSTTVTTSKFTSSTESESKYQAVSTSSTTHTTTTPATTPDSNLSTSQSISISESSTTISSTPTPNTNSDEPIPSTTENNIICNPFERSK